MTTDETAQPTSNTGSLPFDTSQAHHARIYDYLLGSKNES